MRTSRASSYGYQDTIKRETNNPYWASFTDLMASVMIIFLLTTVYFALMSHAIIESEDVNQTLTDFLNQSVQSVELETKLNLHDDSNARSSNDLSSETSMQLANVQPTLKEDQDKSLHQLQGRLADEGIESKVNQSEFVLHIPTDQLHFKQGDYKIGQEGVKVINNIATQLYTMLVSDSHLGQFKSIAIEGHTDSIPADSLPMGNWGLSTYRAITFWKHITSHPEYGEALAQLNNMHGQRLFSVSGYADTRRIIEDDDTPDKQATNRRIDIRFTTSEGHSTDSPNGLPNNSNKSSPSKDKSGIFSSRLP